jgi:ABC-type multidrug transport system fused ATPase/permease subunit
MDEATANIDVRTEEFIQNAVKTSFKNVTVITIAHRIKTIIDYDRIMVLDAGEVKEFDTPDNLIQNKNSIFYQLYNESGI